MEENLLIQSAGKGDLNAFNELVLKYQNQAFNHASRLLGNHDIAEDITQEAFLLAFRRLYQYRGGSFRAWLLKIVTNLCYSEMRTWKRNDFQALEPVNREGETNESPPWLGDLTSLPEEQVEIGELHEQLESIMNKLPSVYRTALSLVDIQEFDYKEAATIMGVSVGTVKSRLARGRMQFRQIWNAQNIPDQDAFTVSKTKGEYHVNFIG
ncbi:MAG TPA: sigma-70 family RNA polymerase sigma factor [Anaerolineales bacterium]|nr:sigma-70 family RNA polymerase sigma factor [Anaerolineales bacterium]